MRVRDARRMSTFLGIVVIGTIAVSCVRNPPPVEPDAPPPTATLGPRGTHPGAATTFIPATATTSDRGDGRVFVPEPRGLESRFTSPAGVLPVR